MSQAQKASHDLVIDSAQCPFTLGRSDSANFCIGMGLGEWNQGISGIQATILFEDNQFVLVDGSPDRPSSNGIWLHTGRITEAVPLVAGVKLTLYKHGLAKVEMTVLDKFEQSALHRLSHKTYGEDDLTSILQAQAIALQEQITALSGQLEQRLAVDEQQQQRLDKLQSQVRKSVAGVLAFGASLVVLNGLMGELSAEEQDRWQDLTFELVSKGLMATVLGGTALYVSKEGKKDE